MKKTVSFQENEQTFDASFDQGADMRAEFGELQMVGVEVSGSGTTDHSQLTNRDKADQHPMSAITGLVKALDGKQPSGSYLTKESDPSVPAWAKQATKPSYTAKEIGALPADTVIPSKTSQLKNDSGFLTEADPVGSAATALKTAKEYTDKQIAAIPTPDVSSQISTHNTATDAHNDIRLLVYGLTDRLNALANSDDTTLDQMAEVVAYIKDNRELIEQVTTGKVSVLDIVDNLSTNVSDKPLSAAQGVVLKSLVDSLATSLNGKLEASALTDAINLALAQAKESGEFDGADGKDGYTPQKGIDYFDGESGIQGEPGYTPVKGVDYWTDADKQEMVAETVEALPVYDGENEGGEASGSGVTLDVVSFNGTVNTGVSSDTADGQKTGNVVQVTLALTSATSGSTTSAVQMPYVPVAETRSFIANPAGKLCRIILRTTGMLDIYPVEDGATRYYGQVVFITPNEGG